MWCDVQYPRPGLVPAVGWPADRFGAHSVSWWGLSGIGLPVPSLVSSHRSSHPCRRRRVQHALALAAFIALTFVMGAVFAIGMPSTFKYVADDFPANIGVVTGIVGRASGLGGFLLSIFWRAV